MLRTELEQRVGTLENWQWEIAHHVYQWHDSIKDVGGKEQIADIVRQGWLYGSPIFVMYEELKGPVVIKYSNGDLYSTWDVIHTGYCINDKPRPISEVFEQVNSRLQSEYPELYRELDYFSNSVKYEPDSTLWPKFRWIAVFYVRGGSEGYYIHVETRNDGAAKIMFLGKTLLEGKAGRELCEKIVAALSRIMDV